MEITQKITSLDSAIITSGNRAILSKLLSLPEFQCAERILTYLSVGNEVDTRELIAHCLSAGIPVALPRTEPQRRMSFALINSLENLSISAFGIPEPDSALPAIVPQRSDLVVVPALCYDERGFRLGHGGGYYDRYLESCPAVTVGLCREALLSARLPVQAHDVPVSVLVTENKIARPLRVSQI